MQPLIQLALWALIFIPAEYLFAVYPLARSGREAGQNLILMVLNSYVTVFVIAGITYTITMVLGPHVPATWHAALAGQSWWLQILEAMLLIDLGIYAGHRLMHGRLLWRFHEIHHSATQMNWLAAFRNHPVDMTLYTVFSAVPAVLIGIAPGALAAAKLIHGWQTILSHANTRLVLGPLRFVLVGPAFHHWHHAETSAAHDKNYGALFVFWDFIFGTLNRTGQARAQTFGTHGPIDRGIADLIAGPFRPAPIEPPAKQAAA